MPDALEPFEEEEDSSGIAELVSTGLLAPPPEVPGELTLPPVVAQTPEAELKLEDLPELVSGQPSPAEELPGVPTILRSELQPADGSIALPTPQSGLELKTEQLGSRLSAMEARLTAFLSEVSRKQLSFATGDPDSWQVGF